MSAGNATKKFRFFALSLLNSHVKVPEEEA